MSQHFDHPNPVWELELSYSDKAMENKQMIYCSACKTLLRKVIQYIGKTASKDEINRKLDTILKSREEERKKGRDREKERVRL
ncbi:hypothetical protein Q8A67_019577 [Cirrhinus molitorella]|uniref:Uncharacterized protein n=1 Tax=Cirrhinus molitorella TaxID=172907 RepID=A0AA88TGH7_9TELE|nr:hypothetical protein Q8A67_019577 [Cirrhinus molitorella]